ncbi:MAG: hypothetical protein AAGA97_00460 [Pseudomonadota bacterium]
MADQDQYPQNHIDRFNEVSLAAAQQRLRDDALDQGLESAGLSGSRRVRFGVGEANTVDAEGRSKKERIRRTLEWLLLNDAEYARLHGEAMTAVRSAAETAREVMRQIEKEMAAIHGTIAKIMDSAAQLQDGRKVFRDKNGVVRFADGEIVPDALADTIEWRGDEPGYEYARRVLDRESQLTDALHEIRGIEVEIGGYRDELTNNEAPAERGRIPEIIDRINHLSDKIETSMPGHGAFTADAVKSYEAGNTFEKSDLTINISR